MASEADSSYPGYKLLDTDYSSYLILYACAQYNHEADETGETGEPEEAHNLVLAVYVRDADMANADRVNNLVGKLKEMVPSHNFDNHKSKLHLQKDCPKGDLQEAESMMTYSAAYEKYSGKDHGTVVGEGAEDEGAEAEAAGDL